MNNKIFINSLICFNIFAACFFIATHYQELKPILIDHPLQEWSQFISSADASPDNIFQRVGTWVRKSTTSSTDFRRDTDGVVEQVLNYTAYGNTSGDGVHFYKRVGMCHYRLYQHNPDPNQPKEDPRKDVGGFLKGFADAIKEVAVTTILNGANNDINLINTDKDLFTFGEESSDKYFEGGTTILSVLKYDDKPLMVYVGELDGDRVERGWKLIFEHYCPGIHLNRPF